MTKHREEEERLRRLREDGDDSWRTFYRDMRDPFRLYFFKYARLDATEVGELFQEAMIIFHRNVSNGKLGTPLQSSLKTYLFGIGKMLCRKRSGGKEVLWEDDIPEQGVAAEIETATERQEKAEMVRRLLNRVGEPCRSLLHLVYIKGYAMESVAAEMDFPSEGAVRKRKFDCLKKLRAMLS